MPRKFFLVVVGESVRLVFDWFETFGNSLRHGRCFLLVANR